MRWKGEYHILPVNLTDPEIRGEVLNWRDLNATIPDRRELEDVAELAQSYSMYGDEIGWRMTEITLSSHPGVFVYVLARDYVVVYWAGDTRIHRIIKALTTADLTELLVSKDSNIRKCAKKKYERLTEFYDTATTVRRLSIHD